MFLVIYDDHGKEPEYMMVCYTVEGAKHYIGYEMGVSIPDEDYETDEHGHVVYVLGDSQYIIWPVDLWSNPE